MRRIGVHVSIAGKIWESLERARRLGCNTVQLFSRNPRSWQAAEFDAADIEKFKRLKAKYGICPVVMHVPYIINLATPDDGLYKKSIAAFIEDVGRADSLGAEYLVTHLGSHTGSGEPGGMRRFAAALDGIIRSARPAAMILLENTAGSGSWIGYRFEHLKNIIEGVADADRLGVCLDTAHTFESGYDIRSAAGLKGTLDVFDALIGTDSIKVVHFNDSLSEMSSRVDRHHHIGKGTIGSAAMKRIINSPRLKHAAFIMETPKESDADDRRNLTITKRMIKRKA
jgi:deoxyribonuclease-4